MSKQLVEAVVTVLYTRVEDDAGPYVASRVFRFEFESDQLTLDVMDSKKILQHILNKNVFNENLGATKWQSPERR